MVERGGKELRRRASLSYDAELFKWMAGIKMLHVPYKGGSQAVIDLVGGRVTMYFAATPTAFPLIKAGKLRALGVTSPKRYPGAPEIPTIAESGVPGYELVGWFAILVPAGTPQEVVAKLHAGTVKALQTPELARRLAAEGIEATGGSPRELDAFIRKEIFKYEKIVRAANIKPE